MEYFCRYVAHYSFILIFLKGYYDYLKSWDLKNYQLLDTKEYLHQLMLRMIVALALFLMFLFPSHIFLTRETPFFIKISELILCTLIIDIIYFCYYKKARNIQITIKKYLGFNFRVQFIMIVFSLLAGVITFGMLVAGIIFHGFLRTKLEVFSPVLVYAWNIDRNLVLLFCLVLFSFLISFVSPLVFQFLFPSRKVNEKEKYLEIFLEEAGRRNGIVPCKIRIAEVEHLKMRTAFTAGLNVGFIKPVIVISDALLEKLSLNEIKGIISHELVHIKKNHMFYRILLFYFCLFFISIQEMSFYTYISIPFRIFLNLLIVGYLVYCQEIEADVNASQIAQVDKNVYASALEKVYLENEIVYDKQSPARILMAAAAHPSLDTRLNSIKASIKAPNIKDILKGNLKLPHKLAVASLLLINFYFFASEYNKRLLFSYIQKEDIVSLKRFHEKSENKKYEFGSDKDSPFQIAIFRKKEKSIEFFLNHTSNFTDVNALGENVLHTAAYLGNEPLVVQLLKRGANPKVVSKKRGHTAFTLACASGNLALVKLLWESGNYDINYTSGEGRNALVAAIRNNHFHVFSYLVSKGADVSILKSKNSFIRESIGNMNYPMRFVLSNVQIHLKHKQESERNLSSKKKS